MSPSIKNDIQQVDAVSTRNMATTPMDAELIRSFRPENFRRGDDLDTFIKNCERYFEIIQASPEMKTCLIPAFLDEHLREEYEVVDEKIVGYQERLRKAFSSTSTMMDDISKAFGYKRGGDSAEVYFKKIEKLVKNIMKHKFNEDELTTYFLLHCAEDKELEKEVKMRDLETSKDLKIMIKKLDQVRTETNNVNVIRSFSSVVKNNSNAGRPTPKRVEPTYLRTMTCYNCEKQGHIARECRQPRQQRQPTCYGCGVKGHIRRECPTLNCTRCNRRGHLAKECYTNLNRECQHNPSYPMQRRKNPRVINKEQRNLEK